MGKAPAFQFYPGDWSRDLEEHPLEIEGAWIRICCKLWWSETRGELTKSLVQWSRILRVSEEKTLELLNYIKNEKIGKIPTNLTEPNESITVISRRMLREEKERESGRLRQRRHYTKKKCDTKPNGNLTLPSSSSSSPSKKCLSKDKRAEPVFSGKKNGHYSDKIDRELVEQIDSVCKKIKVNRNGFNPYQFVQKTVQFHPKALLHVLEQIAKDIEGVIKSPWAYANKILLVQNGNFNERDAIQAHKEFKRLWAEFVGEG